MVDLKEIKRVLWHEIGHLCTSIYFTDKFPEFEVSEFKLNYHSNAIGSKWAGLIKRHPTYKLDETDDILDLIVLEMIITISGCIFETYYYNCMLENSNKTIENCFCKSNDCHGQNDHEKMKQLVREPKKKYKYTISPKEIIDNIISNTCYSQLESNVYFVNQMDVVIDEISMLIIKDCVGIENLFEYEYKFNKDDLVVYIEKIKSIMIETNFYDVLEDIHERAVLPFASLTKLS